jgi:hypothetical protein
MYRNRTARAVERQQLVAQIDVVSVGRASVYIGREKADCSPCEIVNQVRPSVRFARLLNDIPNGRINQKVQDLLHAPTCLLKLFTDPL